MLLSFSVHVIHASVRHQQEIWKECTYKIWRLPSLVIPFPGFPTAISVECCCLLFYSLVLHARTTVFSEFYLLHMVQAEPTVTVKTMKL